MIMNMLTFTFVKANRDERTPKQIKLMTSEYSTEKIKRRRRRTRNSLFFVVYLFHSTFPFFILFILFMFRVVLSCVRFFCVFVWCETIPFVRSSSLLWQLFSCSSLLRFASSFFLLLAFGRFVLIVAGCRIAFVSAHVKQHFIRTSFPLLRFFCDSFCCFFLLGLLNASRLRRNEKHPDSRSSLAQSLNMTNAGCLLFYYFAFLLPFVCRRHHSLVFALFPLSKSCQK